MFHLCFGLSDHLKALLDFVFGSRRRVKKVRIFRAWFSQKDLGNRSKDEAFLLSLRRSLKTARGVYPPVALAEIYQEYKSPLTKIRRLHLMVVDLS